MPTKALLTYGSMKRSEVQDDSFQSKKPKLDEGRPAYTADSARLISEWDDEDLDCALEEVCIIAELSQVVRPAGDENVDLESENKRLRDALRKKEGEVDILRSQLAQNRALKHNEAVNYRKTIEQMEQTFQTNLTTVNKQIDKLEGELEFKNLELQGLKGKCKQLEVKNPVVNFIQPSSANVDEKKLFSLSQAITKTKASAIDTTVEILETENVDIKKINEGQTLSSLLLPSFFQEREEPSVVPMYPLNVRKQDPFDPEMNDKYKWIGLPRHESHLRKLDAPIMELLGSEIFLTPPLESIRNITIDIMKNLIKMLEFLNTLPKSEDYDRALLENVDPGRYWNMEMLLSNELVMPNEKGFEARRVLALLTLICRASSDAIETLATPELLSIIAKVCEWVGLIKRPLEYASVCIATLYFLQTILSSRAKGQIGEATIERIREIIKQVIMTRSKLDVLREVIKTLTFGAHHRFLASRMCTRGSVRSCAFYVDVKFQKAIFFTRDACPLKVLQLQIKNLSHLCPSKQHFLSVFHTFMEWLDKLLSSSYKPQLWLFPQDICCDILECCSYLLNLCLPRFKTDVDYKKAFELGIETMRNCSRGHKRKFKLSTVKLLITNLRTSGIVDSLAPRSKEAALFILSEKSRESMTANTSFKSLSTTVAPSTG